jgi:hypothetical protein
MAVKLHRNYRIKKNDPIRMNYFTLYHQTDESSARAIISSQTMIPGTSGRAGGAIYFSSTPIETIGPARRRGVILQCEVLLGNIKDIGTDRDGSMNYQTLKSQGYDSLKRRDQTTSFVVYNTNQIRRIQRHN